MMNKLISTVSPHFHTPRSTQMIMLDVIIALVPAEIASAIIFGWRALLIVAVCVGTCVLSEFLFEKLCKRENTVSDLSSIVTGILLAFNLPVTIPIWQAMLGSVIAIIVVKQLFGGIGQNFANPAITARIIMLVAFSGDMTKWITPSGFFTDVNASTSATPLLAMTNGTDVPSYLDLFLGRHGGSLGETCALALLLGGGYLGRSAARRVLHGDRLRHNSKHKMGQNHLRRGLRPYHHTYPLLGQLPRGRELLDTPYEYPHAVYLQAHALKAAGGRC